MNKFFKRLFDIVFSILLLIPLSPVMLIIALIIRLTSKGSALFYHKRLGYQGEEFYLYKFRTMVENAEILISSFTEDQKREFEASYKLKNDPRITSFGKILRKTSLDELPQLFNVIKGEMSIVGPRPIIRDELNKYGKFSELFLSVKPGITGLWQISGRSGISYDDRIKLDIYYIQNYCLLLDVKIFFKTFKEVALRVGAY